MCLTCAQCVESQVHLYGRGDGTSGTLKVKRGEGSRLCQYRKAAPKLPPVILSVEKDQVGKREPSTSRLLSALDTMNHNCNHQEHDTDSSLRSE